MTTSPPNPFPGGGAPHPANDPAADLVGTVRRDQQGRLYVRTDEAPPAQWVVISGPPLFPSWRTPGSLADTTVVGAVPGTPASEVFDVDGSVRDTIARNLIAIPVYSSVDHDAALLHVDDLVAPVLPLLSNLAYRRDLAEADRDTLVSLFDIYRDDHLGLPDTTPVAEVHEHVVNALNELHEWRDGKRTVFRHDLSRVLGTLRAAVQHEDDVTDNAVILAERAAEELRQWRSGVRITQETSDAQDRLQAAEEAMAGMVAELDAARVDAAIMTFSRDTWRTVCGKERTAVRTLRADLDRAEESRKAWAIEADRLDQITGRLRAQLADLLRWYADELHLRVTDETEQAAEHVVNLDPPPADLEPRVQAAVKKATARPHRPPYAYEVSEWCYDGRRVECFSGRNPDDVIHIGRAVGYTEAPTVRVQKDDGQVISWVIGLTRPAPTEEADRG